MEKLKRRLKYYGIGFGLGLIFVFFFFRNRGCSWLPSNRVKNAILDRCLVVSNQTDSLLTVKGMSVDDIVQVLNDGDVNFGDSEKNDESKVYILERDGIKYAFTLPYESFISEVFVDVANTNIESSSTGQGRFIHFPADDHLVFPDSTTLMTCQQEKLGLIDPKKILEMYKNSGRIDFGKSNLEARPKPEHYLTFVLDNKTIGSNVIWYKNKLNITRLYSDDILDCD